MTDRRLALSYANAIRLGFNRYQIARVERCSPRAIEDRMATACPPFMPLALR